MLDYIKELETQVDPNFVKRVRGWAPETKLYMYLHHIQLAHMEEFKKLLKEHNDQRSQ